MYAFCAKCGKVVEVIRSRQTGCFVHLTDSDRHVLPRNTPEFIEESK